MTPVQAAERVRDALRAANSAFDDMDLMAASYCELCEAHAPKHDDGSLAGPVAHKADCAVGKVRAALAQADALVEVVRALEEAAEHFDRISNQALHWMQVVQKNEIAEGRWSKVKTHAAHRAAVALAALAALTTPKES